MTIGIVGGGKGGLELLRVFLKSKLARVSYVCDINPDAVAMKAAKAEAIEAITDLDRALKRNVDFLIESTGSEKVLAAIRDKLPATTRLIDNRVALFLFQIMLEYHRQSFNAKVIEDIYGIRKEIVDSLAVVNRLTEEIDEVTGDLNMLGLNARIEAARVGQEGAGFAVVARAVQSSAETVRKIAHEISGVSSRILVVSDRIEDSLKKLQE